MGTDKVIFKVLDSLLLVTGIDPAAVEPEDRLIEDLDMTDEQVFRFIANLVSEFQLREGFAVKERRNLSLRHVVALVKAEQEAAA